MSAMSFRVLHPKEWASRERAMLSQIGVDLLEGIESYTPKDESDPSIPPAPLAPLLQAFEHVRSRLSRPPHFVTFRNNLNKILGTPYNTSSGWVIGVEKRDGCVYLDVRRSQDELERNKHPHANQIRACYAGRRFELYSTQPASTQAPAIEGNEYCSLFTLSLNDKRLVVAAEMDCFDGVDGISNAPSYVELKTTRVLRTDKDRFVFERFKLLSFWIQSYIVGTPKIICGFRSDDFELQKLQTFATTEIPSFCRKHWDPRVCINFMDALLQWILERTEEGCAYEATYYPREHQVEMRPLDRGLHVLPK